MTEEGGKEAWGPLTVTAIIISMLQANLKKIQPQVLFTVIINANSKIL
jgi:hypothetical protein